MSLTLLKSKFSKENLAVKQAAVAVFITIILGIVFSSIQIYLDHEKIKNEELGYIEEVLEIIKPTITEAVFQGDKQLIEVLSAGLLKFESICEVIITDSEDSIFVNKGVGLKSSKSRWISDLIYGTTLEIKQPLFLPLSSSENYSYDQLKRPIILTHLKIPTKELFPNEVGTLKISVDTVFLGEQFLSQSLAMASYGFFRNLILAFLLILVFHHFLTKPVLKVKEQLMNLDLNSNESPPLEIPKGHENDELGMTIAVADSLIKNARDAQIKLIQERQTLQTVINCIPDHIVIKDTSLRYVLVNHHIIKLYDANHSQELIGKTDRDFEYYHEEVLERFNRAERQVINSGKAILNAEEQWCVQDGKKVWISLTRVPWKDEKGNIIGVIVSARDISEIKNHNLKLGRLVEERTQEIRKAYKLNLILANCLHHYLIMKNKNQANPSEGIILKKLHGMILEINQNLKNQENDKKLDPLSSKLITMLNQLLLSDTQNQANGYEKQGNVIKLVWPKAPVVNSPLD